MIIIDFNLDNKLKENIEKAVNSYKEWYSSLAVDYLIFEGLGKTKCKTFKVSPDAVMQLGFQVCIEYTLYIFISTLNY